ncbi:hypothetical protein SCALIN_C04_0166 [Candidatus Scalindua japonica]|uniref:Uncharacterized protein n=1 Tax=Candidatus Scalindua japonica TaxID=1284222 RepID=A0A286TUW5_9BACT|nr:hypothetical protein [Candidatus Scalindua japonica]GAX59678.1 hypothetical protein SCALIN_C04_0166 [Candidatus Scalindua japonica]
MINIFRKHPKYIFGLIAFIFALCAVQWTGGNGFFRQGDVEAAVVQKNTDLNEDAVELDESNPLIQAAMAVQNRHTNTILMGSGIVGTAIGLTKDGQPAMLILAESFESARSAYLPSEIEGLPCIVKITGEIITRNKQIIAPPVDPTQRFPRPVPIGVSTGHPSITAGTIGCRVTDGTDIFALSNNHVYADENNASIGDNVIQPGTFDGGVNPDDAIGTLYDYEPIVFSTTANNVIDAAIALSSLANLGNATPSDGYGTPKSQIARFVRLNQRVMKYGRTTGQTRGTITGINATVNVGYGSGTARFVRQILIEPGSFSDGGDSGSLIVRAGIRGRGRPVGLLFAGSTTMTVANPIADVLNRFGVTVDGQ